jgi:hypothetical protein
MNLMVIQYVQQLLSQLLAFDVLLAYHSSMRKALHPYSQVEVLRAVAGFLLFMQIRIPFYIAAVVFLHRKQKEGHLYNKQNPQNCTLTALEVLTVNVELYLFFFYSSGFNRWMVKAFYHILITTTKS